MITLVEITVIEKPARYHHRVSQWQADCRFNFGCVGNLGEVTGTLTETDFDPETAVNLAVRKISAFHPGHTFLFARYEA